MAAGLPILTVLILMLALRWSAAKAGMIGLFVTGIIALFFFGYGTQRYPEMGPVGATGGALAEALFSTATILWIVFPALCIHQLQIRSGAVKTLETLIGKISSDPRIAALLVAWFFALFLEGAAGFGTPIALAAPFLVSLGFAPAQSVILVLVGHAVGVSFGALGTPILAQSAATGIDAQILSRANGIPHALLGGMLAACVVVLAKSAGRRSDESNRTSAGYWVVAAAAMFLVPYFVLSYWVGPELPTLGGALLGGVLFALTVRFFVPMTKKDNSFTRSETSFWSAASPYLAVVIFVLATRLIPPIQSIVGGMAWEWTLSDHFQGKFQPFYHPGTLLFAGFFIGIFFQKVSWKETKASLRAALNQIGPVTIALVGMLGLSRLMVHSGMVEVLALEASQAAGRAWPFFSPFVGVLGSFVTGSATASNILFADFQHSTALALNLPAPTILAAHGFGAAIGNIICPHNIIAGCATVGLSGQESVILRRIIGICLFYAVCGGLLSLWLVTRG